MPFTLHAKGGIHGGVITIDASASSQFLSALLLVGASFENGITVIHKGGALPSMPHIDMSVEMLRDFGGVVSVDSDTKSWRVEPGALHGRDLIIEPDLSNAAPFLSIAMLCGEASQSQIGLQRQRSLRSTPLDSLSYGCKDFDE